VKVPLCTIGKACLRIFHGTIHGIWVDREIGKHVFSTFHSSFHLFPHALTFHHHVSSLIIQAKQQAFSHYQVVAINPKPLSVKRESICSSFFNLVMCIQSHDPLKEVVRNISNYSVGNFVELIL
jgi:hypothetical protein